MSSSHLSGSKINVARLHDHIKSQLLSLLDKCYGSKAIVWDTGLEGPMGLIVYKSLLNEHDVNRLFKLQPGRLPENKVQHVIFITRPQLAQMDVIAEIIHGEPQSSRSSKEYHIFFVPRKSLLCLKRLEVKGVKGNFSFDELPCYLYPFDSDVMSLELESAFKEYYLENDPTCLHDIAQSIIVLQNLYGTIPHITTLGPASQRVAELIKRLAEENACYEENLIFRGVPQQIDQLIILDRITDLISPLATQLTYEGLLDEVYPIRNGMVELPAQHFTSDEGNRWSAEKKPLVLNSGEELFAEIRDKNFNAVGPALNKKAKLISSQIGDLNRDKSVQEMKEYVSRLPYMLSAKKSLANHTTITELLKKETDADDFLESLHTEQEFMSGIDTEKSHPFIEDAIAKKRPLTKVLRLMCLQSLTNSGLKPKVLEFYKREILQTYGFQHILTLTNLEKAGLLRGQPISIPPSNNRPVQQSTFKTVHFLCLYMETGRFSKSIVELVDYCLESSRPYTILRKSLKLTVEDGSEVNPTDVTYVHSVYAPLSVRLIQHLSKAVSCRVLNEVLGHLPGPYLNETKPPPTTYSLVGPNPNGDSPRVVLVFFVGGCTFAEISALRFLSQQEDSNVEYIVATTKLINGNSFLQSLTEPLGRGYSLQ